MENRLREMPSLLTAEPRHVRRDTCLIFLAGLFLFVVGLGHQEFINFESRFALFAQDMFRVGVHVFPTIYGVPYPDYPATSTLLIYLCSLPFGQVIQFSAVFPSAVFAAATLSCIYLITAPHSRKWGLCSVLFTLFTVCFFANARTISLDMYTTAITTFCFYAVYARDAYKKRTLCYFIPLALIIGFLCRGPIGLVIPSGIVCGYYVLAREWRRLFYFVVISLVILVVMSLLLIAAAQSEAGNVFMHNVIMMEVTGRLSPEDAEAFWFYFRTLWGNYALAAPFALLVCLGIVSQLFRRTDNKRVQLIQQLLLWTLIILIGLSIPGGKKTRYILAITPAIAMMAAYLFIAVNQVFWLRFVRRFFTWLFFIFPFIGAAITLLARNYAYHHGLHIDIKVNYTYIFIWLALLQIAVIIYGFSTRNTSKKEVIALAVATLSFVGINILIVEPAERSLNSARPFVTRTERLRAEHPGALYFYHASPDGSPIKYFVNAENPIDAQYVNTQDALTHVPSNSYVVIENEDYQELPDAVQKRFNTLLAGNFGRDEALVIQRNH